MYDSEELTMYIEKQMTKGFSSFVWVIGGSLGLLEEIFK